MKFSELKGQFGAFKVYVVIAVLLGLSGYLGFVLGNENYAIQQQLIDTHEVSIKNLKAENSRLTKDLNILGVELEVARLAERRGFADIQNGLQREQALNEKIAFFEMVMAPELTQDGFLIEGFNIEPSLSDKAYRFELILLQQNKIKRPSSGRLNAKLVGSLYGEPHTIALDALLVNQDKSGLRYSFKYFQLIEGELILPEGFLPEKVEVKTVIYQNKRKKGELETSFDWPSDTNIE